MGQSNTKEAAASSDLFASRQNVIEASWWNEIELSHRQDNNTNPILRAIGTFVHEAFPSIHRTVRRTKKQK
jgi:hypothetical protein